MIARQNDTELYVIMRSIYLQYGRNLNSNIADQINRLNILVANEAMPKIITALKQKIKYLDDIENLPVPLERAQNISNAGENSVIYLEFFTVHLQEVSTCFNSIFILFFSSSFIFISLSVSSRYFK